MLLVIGVEYTITLLRLHAYVRQLPQPTLCICAKVYNKAIKHKPFPYRDGASIESVSWTIGHYLSNLEGNPLCPFRFEDKSATPQNWTNVCDNRSNCCNAFYPILGHYTIFQQYCCSRLSHLHDQAWCLLMVQQLSSFRQQHLSSWLAHLADWVRLAYILPETSFYCRMYMCLHLHAEIQIGTLPTLSHNRKPQLSQCRHSPPDWS